MIHPILPGFHPDPSICRVGDTYYLANSSFEYVPGVPIFRSTDLTSWELVGHALSRSGQIAPSDGGASGGIFAPTLRHHGDRFYLVTTNMAEAARGHLIVTAEDPAGAWSNPVYVAGTVGVDPDLSWDEAGICYLTWASFLPTLRGVATVPIDPDTGAMLGEPRLLWNGTGMSDPEAPHLYRIDGWWYLLLAEGGTERGHAVTIARAPTLDAPFEPAPMNPILTHRSTDHPVQNTGHADLVQASDGTWAMVYLGVRPRGITPNYHVNGRETFLAGVNWMDGWPVVIEDRFTVPSSDHSFIDTFESADLDLRWVAPGEGPASLTRWAGPGELVMTAVETREAPNMLLTRTRDEHWTAVADVDVSRGAARFILRIDERHWYGLTAENGTVTATFAVGPAISTVATIPLGSPEVRLQIRAIAPDAPDPMRPPAEPDLIELAIVHSDVNVQVIGTADGRYLSTEVAGGYTGRMVGIEVVEGSVVLHGFRYRSDQPAA